MEQAFESHRRLPIGAEALPGGGVHFRVWAPRSRRAAVVIGDAEGTTVDAALTAETDGYFSARVDAASAGTLYRYRLDDSRRLLPDPASRYQPEGPEGPSIVVDPRTFPWTDHDWRGVALEDAVVYELHVGTFTREGTWSAAAEELEEIAATGITVLEVMPVADFPGLFGWGYDGVNLYAPTRLYGTPDDFRGFVDRAHSLGLAVVLDVVYNHLGPSGNYLSEFSPDYFTDRYENEWGDAINFDGPSSRQVREFVIENAGYWIEEFHLDGLRLDATQQIFDRSPRHVLEEIAGMVRKVAGGRRTLLIVENEPQDVRLVRPVAEGGYGMDAVWNDDFHHSAIVALTGRREAYYTDYYGSAQELVSAVKWGYLFQGQRYTWQNRRRGTPAFGVPPAAFVNYLQNHDQIANSGSGERIHHLGSPGSARALTALLLLGPGTPLLFQGQEFSASAPFLYFADHNQELATAVRDGRRHFLSQFPNLGDPRVQAALPDPDDPETFRCCKLDFSERESHAKAYALHRDLLRLRREQPAFRAGPQRTLDGAVLGPQAFVIRFFTGDHQDRLLIVNLGRSLRLDPAPEPLLAPPAGDAWQTLWSSDDPRYGGPGRAQVEADDGWHLPGHAAVVLSPSTPGPDPASSTAQWLHQKGAIA